MKWLSYLLFALSLSFIPAKAHAQIGPYPCGANSSVTTWRNDYAYSIGQVVILNGVTYQSLANNNMDQNPCTFSGTLWTNIINGSGGGGGGSVIPATPNVLKGSGVVSIAVPAIPGVDYLLPTGSAAGLTNFPIFNQSTTGQSGTALTLATAPTLCATGSAPTGVLANGNATGCAPVTTATIPATTSLLKGSGSLGVSIAAIANIDYLTPTGSAAGLTSFPTFNQNTTGNAATSTVTGALSSTPTVCASGFAPTGISANGNAISCQLLGGGATIPPTVLLLKGTGVAGVSQSAIPDTDYVIPSITVNGHPLSSNVVISASDITTGTLPHAQLPTLLSGDIPNNAANTSGTASNLSGTPALPNGTTATTQTTGDNTAKLATDAFVIANSGGAPPGSTTQVIYNNGGVYGADSTFTFNNSTKTVTAQNSTQAPLGTATALTNYGSGTFSNCISYWTGTGPAEGCATIQSTVSSGINPYMSTNFVFTNAGGGQFNFPYSLFLNGFSIDAANNSGIFQIVSPANMPGGNYAITPPPTAPSGSDTVMSCAPSSSPSTIPSICAWTAGGSGGGAVVTPQQFGGYGDALGPQDGMGTTASSNVVTCPDGCFVSGDVGKQVWVKGAGPSGAAFNATIVTVTDFQHVVVSANATATIGNLPQNGVYGHDDVTAIQACWDYSAKNGVPCAMTPAPIPTGGAFSGFLGGFLVGSGGLQISTGPTSSGPNVTGGAMTNNVNLFCEFNGDCVSLAAGPIQGATLSNLSLQGDQTQPSGRGFHFNAQAGPFGIGGLWNSTLTNTLVQNFNLECMLSEGGNYLSGGLLPNQIDTFNMFQCNAPQNQMHTANLIKMTGQHAQILFVNGQTNGPAIASNQPNAMILITEQNTGHGDSATDIKFYGYTYEVGLIGLQLGNGAYSIHYDNSYVENVASPLIAGGNPLAGGVYGMTYNGNHIANSGNGGSGYIAQFTGGVTGSMRDNLEYGGGVTVNGLAVCTGTSSSGIETNSVDFVGNVVLNGPSTTSGCVTTPASASGSTLTIYGGTTITVPTYGTPIQTINTATSGIINPGKTLTLYATGAFSLATGGNINLGGFSSPLSVQTGGTVTLTLLDLTNGWTVTSATPSSGGAVTGTTALHTSSISSGACQTVTAGSVNSSAATGATSASKIIWTPAASLQSVTGYQVSTSGALSIDAYPTSGFVNFNVCNWTAGSVTPGALTLNWELHP